MRPPRPDPRTLLIHHLVAATIIENVRSDLARLRDDLEAGKHGGMLKEHDLESLIRRVLVGR